jgi:hypothetical protein
MATYPPIRDIVRAIASGEGVKAKNLVNQLPDEDHQAYFIFLSAVMAGALDHHFKTDHSREAITRFVNEMRYEYRKVDPPINTLVIEGVIRGFFGEDHLLNGMSTKDKIIAAYPIIRSIVARSRHMQDNLDKYFTDAEMLAQQWAIP